MPRLRVKVLDAGEEATEPEAPKGQPHRWKPGESGNPAGRPPGSRNKLSEDFFRGLCKAWEVHGDPALTAAAFLHPMEFCRMVASLMPKEMRATVESTVRLERMSSAELRGIIAEGISRGMHPELPLEGSEILQ